MRVPAQRGDGAGEVGLSPPLAPAFAKVLAPVALATGAWFVISPGALHAQPREARSVPLGQSIIHVAPPLPGAPPGDGSALRPLRDLGQAVRLAAERRDTTRGDATATVALESGDYDLTPEPISDPACGNCQNPEQAVPATVGLRLTGRGVCLLGAPNHGSVIHTRAGYGILLQNCRECSLLDLVITDGARDTSGEATDAAVVVQRSTVEIRNCWIRDNIGDSILVRKHIVGIIGIAGREGSSIAIRGNRILRNSWDGIALYHGARATIEGNTIDGVDLALGTAVGGGRGVGIGLTWDAEASVRGNRVTRYWKGIGVFVDAKATVEWNVVEHVAAWGLSLWDAGAGHPHGDFHDNVVDSTGACGVMIACGAEDGGGPAGALRDNVICRTGQNPKYDSGEPYCFQTAIALHGASGRAAGAAPANAFPVQGNLFFNNREAGGTPGSGDRDPALLHRSVQQICARLAVVDATRESAFVRRLLGPAAPEPPGGTGTGPGAGASGSESPGETPGERK